MTFTLCRLMQKNQKIQSRKCVGFRRFLSPNARGFALATVMIGLALLGVVSVTVTNMLAARMKESKVQLLRIEAKALLPLIETYLARATGSFIEQGVGVSTECATAQLRFNNSFASLDVPFAGVTFEIADASNLAPLPAGLNNATMVAARNECLNSMVMPATTNICNRSTFTFCLTLLPIGASSFVSELPAFVTVSYRLFKPYDNTGINFQDANNNVLHADRLGQFTYMFWYLSRGPTQWVGHSAGGSFNASTL
jgi:hypothetical protein